MQVKINKANNQNQHANATRFHNKNMARYLRRLDPQSKDDLSDYIKQAKIKMIAAIHEFAHGIRLLNKSGLLDYTFSDIVRNVLAKVAKKNPDFRSKLDKVYDIMGKLRLCNRTPVRLLGAASRLVYKACPIQFGGALDKLLAGVVPQLERFQNKSAAIAFLIKHSDTIKRIVARPGTLEDDTNDMNARDFHGSANFSVNNKTQDVLVTMLDELSQSDILSNHGWLWVFDVVSRLLAKLLRVPH